MLFASRILSKKRHQNSTQAALVSSASFWLLGVLLLFVVSTKRLSVVCLDNGLALRPPMGWLAWERFVCETDCAKNPGECLDASLFEQMAERMAKDGFQQVGYEYINIDDCWSTKERDLVSGKLLPDPQRFPSMRKLADRVHSFGLKLGIYGDCGSKTCQNFPGQLRDDNSLVGNHYDLDAQLFAKWQIDSFKFDGCYMNVSRASSLCPPMGVALNKTGRPMLFSCSWPAYENDDNLDTNWTLVVERCNLWRSFGDIEDSWSSVLQTIDWFVKKQDLIVKFHGPGHWFDADQLVIGNFGLSHEQERAQMAIWCIWATPLYMSNDLRKLNKQSSKLLRNKWLIEVNQDKWGLFGLMVHEERELQVFVKPIEPQLNSCPSYAIAFLFRRTLGTSHEASVSLLKLISAVHAKLDSLLAPKWSHWSNCARRLETNYSAYDLLEGNTRIGRQLNLQSAKLELKVNPSGARMVKLVEEELPPTATTAAVEYELVV